MLNNVKTTQFIRTGTTTIRSGNVRRCFATSRFDSIVVILFFSIYFCISSVMNWWRLVLNNWLTNTCVVESRFCKRKHTYHRQCSNIREISQSKLFHSGCDLRTESSWCRAKAERKLNIPHRHPRSLDHSHSGGSVPRQRTGIPERQLNYIAIQININIAKLPTPF